jgi:hypothetical protein
MTLDFYLLALGGSSTILCFFEYTYTLRLGKILLVLSTNTQNMWTRKFSLSISLFLVFDQHTTICNSQIDITIEIIRFAKYRLSYPWMCAHSQLPSE